MLEETMRKKTLFKWILVGLGLFISFTGVLYASEREPKFFINGRERWDAKIIVKENATYVPLRIVGEELGAQVTYDSKSKQVLVNKGELSLQITVGEKEAVLNGKDFMLSNEAWLYTTEDGKQLTYIPLRNIFEVLNGDVDYNKKHQYVNAYNKEHVAYTALKGLNSEDLTTYRFAQLALPRVGQSDMAIGDGGRSVQYIFPLNQKTNYFFVRTDPSGDMDITTIAYFEIENGVAICKWYKELSGDVKEHINSLDDAINKSLGERGITREVGELPNLEAKQFISFMRNSMMQPSPSEEYAEMYYPQFETMIQILTPQGAMSVPENLIQKTIWSPYAYKYKVANDGTNIYETWKSDILLSQIDESSLM